MLQIKNSLKFSSSTVVSGWGDRRVKDIKIYELSDCITHVQKCRWPQGALQNWSILEVKSVIISLEEPCHSSGVNALNLQIKFNKMHNLRHCDIQEVKTSEAQKKTREWSNLIIFHNCPLWAHIKNTQYIHLLVHGHSSWSTFCLNLVRSPRL